MPSANGTAVLTQFNDIQSTVSFICELADSLAARMFHWTLWHSVPAASCDCDILLGKSVPAIDVLSEQEIMNMYSKLVSSESTQSNRRNYSKSYMKRVRESETSEQTHKRRQADREYKASLRPAETYNETAYRREYNRQCNKTSRAQETPVKTTQRQHMDKTKTSQTQLAKKSKVETIYETMTNEIPDELKDLNNLELHIICKRILFMKLVKLPRGKQKGIKGAAVNVPADLGPACNLLPRLPADAHIVSLKLKRKLEYKQAYLHDTIHLEKVITALYYLKNNNPLYSDIEINEDWI